MVYSKQEEYLKTLSGAARRVFGHYLQKVRVRGPDYGYVHLVGRILERWGDIPQTRHIRLISEKKIVVPVRIAKHADDLLQGRNVNIAGDRISVKGAGAFGIPPWHRWENETYPWKQWHGGSTEERLREQAELARYAISAYEKLREEGDPVVTELERKYSVRYPPIEQPITLVQLEQYVVPGKGRVVLEKRRIKNPQDIWARHVMIRWNPQRMPGYRIVEISMLAGKRARHMRGVKSPEHETYRLAAILGTLWHVSEAEGFAFGMGEPSETPFAAQNATPYGIMDLSTATVPELGIKQIRTKSIAEAREVDYIAAKNTIRSFASAIGVGNPARRTAERIFDRLAREKI